MWGRVMSRTPPANHQKPLTPDPLPAPGERESSSNALVRAHQQHDYDHDDCEELEPDAPAHQFL
jgi:hypothetical protein